MQGAPTAAPQLCLGKGLRSPEGGDIISGFPKRIFLPLFSPRIAPPQTSAVISLSLTFYGSLEIVIKTQRMFPERNFKY